MLRKISRGGILPPTHNEEIEIKHRRAAKCRPYKMFFCFVVLFLTLSLALPMVSATPPELMSEAAILMDPRTGNVLFGQNIHEQMYPASTTKIMTAILAIEHGDLDDMVTIQESALYDMPPLAATLGLEVGEEMSLGDLLSAIMLMSGNDAANVIAEHVAGDVSAFVEMMNERAVELGAYNTNFMNPTGLHDDEHVSTVYDMARISQFAMTIPAFRGTVVNAHIFLDGTNLHPERRYIINTNALVSRQRTAAYYFAPAIGIKTGFTSQAGLCLAAAAGRGRPFELISVTFGAPPRGTATYSFTDTRALFDFGYSNFRQTNLARVDQILSEVRIRYGRGTNRLSLVADAPLIALIPTDSDANDVVTRAILPDYVRAPVEQGERIGEIEFLYNDNVIGRVDLLSNQTVNRRMFWWFFVAVDWVWSFAAVRVIVYILLIGLGLFFILFLIGVRNAIKRSKRKNKYVRRR